VRFAPRFLLRTSPLLSTDDDHHPSRGRRGCPRMAQRS
jgi:hypothetical protein